jgi:hypothetical protein
LRPGVGTVLAAETLRSAANPPPAAESNPDKAEERVSVFWRIFGGTVLSIIALVCVTVYQQVSGAINELRTGITHLNEARADLVTKQDVDGRFTTLWGAVKELQAINVTVQSLKERAMLRDQQNKEEEERKETLHKELHALTAAVTALKERALMQDEQAKAESERKETFCKELCALNTTVTALKERTLLHDQQWKQENERKELVRELHQLRERLATLEGRSPTAAAPTMPPERGD